MPFTQQEENQIRQHLHHAPANDRNRHISSPQAFALFTAGFLGAGFANYLLNKHGWPVVERKLQDIIKSLPR